MKAKKLLAIFLFVAIIISGMATTVYAASEAVPRSIYGETCIPSFSISNGVATVRATYTTTSSAFTRITLKVTIQRKLWNLFWVSYDIGIPDNVWTETKTSSSGTFYNTFNIPDTGNYRCNFTIVFEGTGGTDTIEETINYSYN